MGELNDNDGGVESLIDDNSSGAGFDVRTTPWRPNRMPGDRTVNYVFPVEVVVIGALTEEDYRAIERRIWASFGEAWAQQNA